MSIYNNVLMALFLLLTCACSSSGGEPAAPGQELVDAGSAPTLQRIEPLSGPIGEAITLTGSGFAARNNTVKMGDGYVTGLPSADGRQIQLEIPDGLDMCPPDHRGPCPMAFARVTPGEYEISVIIEGESSDSITFVVEKN